MSKNKRIGIMGSGLVGSMWAVYLAKRGYAVDIFERRQDMRKADISAGRSINLALSNRGFNALNAIGCDEMIKDISIAMYGREIHDKEGNTKFQSYGLDQEAIYSVSRGAINRRMMDEAQKHSDVNLYFNTKCDAIDLDKGHVSLKDTETGKSLNNEYDIVFGADGAFSKVREAMVKTPGFNYSQSYLEHGYKELVIPPAKDGGWRIKKNALHIWPRRSFMIIALPNLDGSFTVTLFLAHKGPVSFEALNTDEKVMTFFQKEFPDALEVMPTLIKDWHENPEAPLVTVRTSPWHRGRSAIMGDAAHAIVPFYGQGMNSGFEDCFEMNKILDQTQDNWDQALELFSQQRVANGHAIADLAIQNFIEMRDSVADEEFLRRKKISKHLVEIYKGKYRPQYDLVTFTQVPYKDALAFGDVQNKILDEITQITNVDERLAEGEKIGEVEGILEKYL